MTSMCSPHLMIYVQQYFRTVGKLLKGKNAGFLLKAQLTFHIEREIIEMFLFQNTVFSVFSEPTKQHMGVKLTILQDLLFTRLHNYVGLSVKSQRTMTGTSSAD